MGETVPGIFSQVDEDNKKYSLWEKEQVYVLVSRVKNLKDITFVGNRQTTLRSLKNVLQRTSQWGNYVEHLLHQICTNTMVPRVIDLNETGFLPYTTQVPNTSDNGFVYMLISRTISQCIYIGTTNTLRQRLRQHNTGNGAEFTNVPERRPWAVYCFVCGFLEKETRLDFENTCHSLMWLRFKQHAIQPNVHQVYSIIVDVLSRRQTDEPNLKVVLCGRLTNTT